MSLKACVHQLPDLPDDLLKGCVVAARTDTREQLCNTLTTVEMAVLLLDLDAPDAINTLVAAHEVAPALPIVGVTTGSDLEVVIQAQRNGCQQISRKPYDAQDLQTALGRVLQAEGGGQGKVYSIIGPTGGAGATTVASHLGMEFASMGGGDALLIDLDFDFGGVARAFDVMPNFTIADLAKADSIDSHNLEKTCLKIEGGPRLIARPRSIADAQAVDADTIRNLLRVARRDFEHVIIDLPRKLDEITGAGIEQCDTLLLVVQLTVPAVDNASRLIDILSAEGIDKSRIELVVNRYRKNMQTCTVEMVEEQLGRKAAALIPSDYSSVHKAIDAGVLLNRKNVVRAAIHDLAQKLIGTAQAEADHAKSGWFGKLGFARGVS